MNKNKLILTMISCLILVSACNSPSDSAASVPTYVAETAAARQAATAVIENALAVVLTGTASVPTITPTITLTPTPTATITPTPAPMATVIKENVPLFAGPAVYFELVVKLTLGNQVEVLGKSKNAAWLFVELPDGVQGWIATELVEFQGEITQFAVIESPPTPDIDFTITIVNNNKGAIHFTIVNFLNTVRVKTGENYQISVPLGSYTFIYFPNRQGGGPALPCEKTFTISYDIYWAPALSDGCDSFP